MPDKKHKASTTQQRADEIQKQRQGTDPTKNRQAVANQISNTRQGTDPTKNRQAVADQISNTRQGTDPTKNRQAVADQISNTRRGITPTVVAPETANRQQNQQAQASSAPQTGRIEPLVEGDINRTMLHTGVANSVINTTNALWNMRGTGGIRVHRSGYNVVIDGSNISGSSDETTVEGGGISFKGEWNASTTYSEDDVVIRIGYTFQAEHKTHTYISKVDDNINNEPPAGDVGNAYWDIVSLGSWTQFYVGSSEKPIDERKTSILGGAAEFHYSGSSGKEIGGANDETKIVGGVVTIGGNLVVTGPVQILLPNDTKIIIDTAIIKDEDDEDVLPEKLADKTLCLRWFPACLDGIMGHIGMIATEFIPDV